MSRLFKIGYGYDSHRFLNEEEKNLIHQQEQVEVKTEFYSKDKKLIIGGVELDEKYQKLYGPFKARSDGDVLYHAVVNALLSAIGDKDKRDIGKVFPNTDSKNSNRNSADFMQETAQMIKLSDYELLDLKLMVKGQPRVDWSKVEKNLLDFFSFQSIAPDIHVQATSGEEMDGAGNGLGVEVFVVALLQHKNLLLSGV
ncbi:MAG: 2-C-methyl-D-erythritol 2,4-cyclodiphosphate synthase [Chlamydiales bacterium]|nr:2-C-methyl-D-erythritol 2,4-cyclodiphosphate synthase [Chlamydiales bacterium]